MTAVARESKQSQAAATVGVEESKGDPGTPSGYTDAALRAQLISVGVPPTQETAAVGVEESKGDDQDHRDTFLHITSRCSYSYVPIFK